MKKRATSTIHVLVSITTIPPEPTIALNFLTESKSRGSDKDDARAIRYQQESDRFKVKWEKVKGAQGYKIYRKTSKNGSWKLIKKLNNETFNYTDKDVKSGVKYTYAVKAVNSGVLSGYYSKTTEYLKKSVVTGAKSTRSGITINYSKTAGADKYYVYRRLSGEDEWTRIATVKGASNVSYKDKTAKKGKTYYYTVRAYSGSYKSAYDTTGYKIKDKY